MGVDRTIRQLEALFEEERKHLLNGALGRLARLTARKDQLIAALVAADPPRDALDRIAEVSQRNQLLLEAARRGVLAAQTRLGEIRRGAPMGTYSKLGEKTEFAKPVRTLQRRA